MLLLTVPLIASKVAEGLVGGEGLQVLVSEGEICLDSDLVASVWKWV